MDITQARPGSGWIEVIAGSMFSGKSEELIRRLRRAQIARRKVQIFKPTVDSRYAKDHIISHSEMRIASETCRHRVSCSSACSPTRKCGCRRSAVLRCRTAGRVQCAGGPGQTRHRCRPDQDYLGKPFEPIPQLLAIAEYITKTLAICVVRGSPANPPSGSSPAASVSWSARKARMKRDAGTASIHGWASERSILAMLNAEC